MPEYLSPLAQPFDFPEGEHGVLLIHGFTGSPAHMRKLGEELHRRGFAVRGILLPGHGTRPEDMRTVSWQDWLLTARQAAREMADQYPFFTAAGLSMGGVLALLLAEERELTACVSLAAPMETRNRFRHLALFGSVFHPMVHKRPKSGLALRVDPAYDVGYRSFPTKSTHDLNVLMGKARRHLSLIHCPMLAVQSHGDETISADSLDTILGGVSSEVKARLWLDEAPHVCTIAPEYLQIAEAMERFLRDAEKAQEKRA